MSDLLRAAIGLFAAIAPFGALPVFLACSRRPDAIAHARLAVFASTFAAAALIASAALADPVLDWLDISPESFQFAAGAIMAPFAARLLLTGTSMPIPTAGEPSHRLDWLTPLGVPLLAGPAAIAAAMSFSARFGFPTAAASSLAVLAVTLLTLLTGAALERQLRPAGVNALGRLSGGLLAVIAVELAVNGVKSV
jgi:multiple antibiotic resistance protein